MLCCHLQVSPVLLMHAGLGCARTSAYGNWCGTIGLRRFAAIELPRTGGNVMHIPGLERLRQKLACAEPKLGIRRSLLELQNGRGVTSPLEQSFPQFKREPQVGRIHGY